MKKYTLKELAETLIKDRKIAGLVRIMSKTDIIRQLSKDFGLHDKDAGAVFDLIRNTDDKEIRDEGIAFGSYERGGNTYPLHPQARKANTQNPDKAISYVYPNRSDDEEIEMEAAGNPMGKTGMRHPAIDFKKSEFPPDYMRVSKEDPAWPFDDGTVQFMKRKNTNKQGFTR